MNSTIVYCPLVQYGGPGEECRGSGVGGGVQESECQMWQGEENSNCFLFSLFAPLPFTRHPTLIPPQPSTPDTRPSTLAFSVRDASFLHLVVADPAVLGEELREILGYLITAVAGHALHF
jgi:hypothetical protein